MTVAIQDHAIHAQGQQTFIHALDQGTVGAVHTFQREHLPPLVGGANHHCIDLPIFNRIQGFFRR